MQIRPQPLSDRAQYFLDGATDAEEMLGAAATWLALYGDRHFIETTVDNLPVQSPWRARHAVALHLQREAFRDAMSASESYRNAFLSSASLSGRRVLGSAAEFYASWFYEDSVWGGCGRPFNRVARHSRRWGFKDPTPSPKAARRLRSRSAIRRYILEQHETIDARRLTMADLAAGPIMMDERAARLLSREWESAVRVWRIAETARERIEQAHAAERRRRGWGTATTVPHDKRKPLLRAARTAGHIVGDEAVREFVAGRPVVLTGDRFLFRVERSGSIARSGHGALSISLVDATTHARLAGLCLYFDGTPALDQLAALGLHLAAGEEADLVDAGNLYGIEPAGAAHPALGAKVQVGEERRRRFFDFADVNNPQAAMRMLAAQYALDLFPVYQDVLADMTVGRRKKELLACGMTPQEIVRAA
ncbi:MAG: hypothetical protein KDJ44_09185 [Rhodoblastus sp.]|nr:hypothetical protein [Rhodoblastus sp.]